MSPFPIELVGGVGTVDDPGAGPSLMRLSAWRRSLGRSVGRSLSRARGRLPLHTLYLQPQGVLAWNMGAAPRATVAATATATAFEHFDAWCRVNPGAQARLFVSGHLLHNLIVDPTLRLRDDEAVRNYARQQFVHYHGAHARQWPLAVWSNAPHGGACAAHAVDLHALRASAATHDVQLQCIAPVWSAGLLSLTRRMPQFARPMPCALALVEGSLVTWMVSNAGTITSMQQRYLDAPRTDMLIELLDQLVAESGPFAHPPVIVGWRLEDGCVLPALRADVMTALGDRDASARWMLDSMDAKA